jgi:hypothetical protein
MNDNVHLEFGIWTNLVERMDVKAITNDGPEITPLDLVNELKRSGEFDNLRKQIYHASVRRLSSSPSLSFYFYQLMHDNHA